MSIRNSVRSLALALVATGALTMMSTAAFAAGAGYSTFFIPGDEDLLAFALNDLRPDGDTEDTMHSLVAVTAWAPNTIVVVDHWEDGYEYDINDPSSSFDEYFTLAVAGEALLFEDSAIPLGRTVNPDPTFCDGTPENNDSACAVDGRDILYVIGTSATVTRGTWLESGNTFQALAWEVYPVRPQLIKYILPFGEELAPTLDDFDRVYALVQATSDNTVLQIDFNGDGTYDSFDHDYNGSLDGTQLILDRGDVYLLDNRSDGPGGTLNTGATVLGSETLQVQYIVGDEGTNYEVRGLSAFPRGFWDDEYYAPVDETTGGTVTDIYLYNPHPNPLTINWETNVASGSFVIGTTNRTVSFNAQPGTVIPNGGAVYLSGNDVFWGISSIDAEGQANDWAYSLVPRNLLDEEYFLGWAPAYSFSELPFAPGNPEPDASGLFITAAQDNTVVFVDEDVDGTPDQTIPLNRLQTAYVTSTLAGPLLDHDLSQARIFATGPYAMAYGQNPDSVAGGYAPALDLGYTVLPTSDRWFDLVLDVEKSANPALLEANAIGEETTFTVRAYTLAYSVDELSIVDTLPAGFEYVAGFTTITLPDNTTVSGGTADDGNTTGATTLTWSGADVFGAFANLAPNQDISISFRARTTVATFDEGELAINNVAATGTRTVQGIEQVFTATDFAFVTFSENSLVITKTSDVDPLVYPGDTINYTVNITNDGAGPLTNISLFDGLPEGVTYVPGTGQIVGFGVVRFADFFNTSALNNNDGPTDWATNWVESDGTQDPAAGNVRVESGELRITGTANAVRTANLSAATSAVLTFDYSTTTNLEGTDQYFVEMASTATGPWTTAVFSGSGNATAGSVFFNVPPGIIGATTSVRVRTNTLNGSSEFFEIDNLVLTAEAGHVFDTFATNVYSRNDGSVNWVGNWVESDAAGGSQSPTAGNVLVTGGEVRLRATSTIYRQVNLTDTAAATLTLAYRTVGDTEPGDVVRIEVAASPAGPWTTVLTYTDGGSGTVNFAIPAILRTATTTVRFGTTDYVGGDEFFFVDNVRVEFVEAVGGTFATDDAPAFASSSDGYVLAPTQSMTLTFQVTVDDPLANNITELTNQACTTATQINLPLCAEVTDPVLNPSAEAGEVGDLVWLDIDGDGIKDPGEPGLANVEVTLKDDFGTPIGVTYTDANGGYRFTGVLAGLGYFVEVTGGLPAGVVQTAPIGNNDNRTDPFDLAAGEVFLDADLGYRAPTGTGIIGDYVWQDVNMNTVQDPGELGLGGVTVLLYRDLNNNGTLEPGSSSSASFACSGPLPLAITDNTPAGVTATATVAGVPGVITGVTVDVDASHTYVGDLIFTLTSAQSTVVSLLDRPGVPADGFGCSNNDVVVTFADGQPNPESTCTGGNPGTTGASWPVALAGPANMLSALNGEVANGVWELNVSDNANNDTGNLNSCELTIQSVTAGADGTPIATTVTAADGSYHFFGVDATDGIDDYFVVVNPSQPALTGYTPSTFPQTFVGALAPNEARLSNDFGFFPAVDPRYSYRDRVWFDPNEDEQDDGETGISGVTVNLLDAARQVITTVTTDVDGYFEFNGLQGSTFYYIEIADVGGVLNDYFGTTAEAVAGELQISNLTGDLDFTVEPTEPNFGYNAYGAVGDTVYNDLNGNNVQDPGEVGIAGVTVQLYNDVNGNGVINVGDNVISTLVTDGNGNYVFAGVPNGDYIVSVGTPPMGFNFTGTDTDGTAGGQQLQATVTAGGSDLDADFGYRVTVDPRTLSGTLFNDANNNGSFDDVGRFANVTIELRDNTNTFIGTTTTNASGVYTFSGLPPAAGYQVRVIDATNVLSGYQATFELTEGGLNPPYNALEIVNLSGASVTNIDFGYYRPPSTPLAVSLSSFHAERGGRGTVFNWTTDNEVGNLGFYLLGEVNEEWVDMSADLIPSAVIDSSARQHYTHESDRADATSFILVDVDVSGKARYHGPFALGNSAVSEPPSQRQIDWTSVRFEHTSKLASRRAAAFSRGTQSTARLLIDEEGLHRLSYESLAAAGFDFGGRTVSSMGLFDRKGAVPMAVVPAGETFGPGMAIEFYAEKSDSLYNKRNQYTLRSDQAGVFAQFNDAPPSGIPQTTYQETTLIENDRKYTFGSPNGDPWYDVWVQAISGPASLNRSIVIEDLVPSAGAATLGLELWGVTYWPAAPDHRVKAILNGVELVDETFDGHNQWSHQVAFDPNLLNTGSDAALTLQLPRDLPGVIYDIVAVDHYSISYPRRLTTRSAAPEKLYFSHPGAGAYRVDGFNGDDIVVYRRDAQGLHRLTGSAVQWNGSSFEVTFSGGGQADYYVQLDSAMLEPEVVPVPEPVDLGAGPARYLVIAHPDFIDAVQPLVNHRAGQGYSTDVVDVEAIYERYSSGMVEPDAIRAYIAEAVENRGTGYVLLVGGDSYDYHDRLGFASLSFIPSIYAQTDELITHAPVDPLYGDLDRDGIVDVPVGRLPVRTDAELAAIIAKVLEFDAKDYEQTLLAATDKYDADQGVSFKTLSDQLLQPLAGSWTITHADIETMGLSTAKQQVLDSLNDGSAFAQYFGHSSQTLWSFDRLLQISDVNGLQNQGRPAMVAQWGCWNNYFVDPQTSAMGVALLTAENRGAAAVLGASTWTTTADDVALGNRFLPMMGQPGRTVGDVLVASKRNLASAQPGLHLGAQWGWTLLGDPLTVLQSLSPGSCVGTPGTGDDDGDGICNDLDICFGSDRIGDIDGDGICHDLDICVGFPDGEDSDTDGVPDGCDLCLGDDALGDPDGDGICGTGTDELFTNGFEVGRSPR